jgi:hypothetical protein
MVTAGVVAGRSGRSTDLTERLGFDNDVSGRFVAFCGVGNVSR